MSAILRWFGFGGGAPVEQRETALAERVLGRPPELPQAFHPPSWWDKYGFCMVLTLVDGVKKRLFITSPYASVIIFVAPGVLGGGERFWRVEWEIRHLVGPKTTGSVTMNDEELLQAFGVEPENCEGASFVREGEYLNIPGRGTGENGSSSISIQVDDQMVQVVTCMLRTP